MDGADLHDPAFEPSDADFERLLHAAGEDARASRVRAESHLRDLLVRAREEVRRGHGEPAR